MLSELKTAYPNKVLQIEKFHEEAIETEKRVLSAIHEQLKNIGLDDIKLKKTGGKTKQKGLTYIISIVFETKHFGDISYNLILLDKVISQIGKAKIEVVEMPNILNDKELFNKIGFTYPDAFRAAEQILDFLVFTIQNAVEMKSKPKSMLDLTN
ncbi:hypothetical protein [Thorsellia anophelis]|uniref:Uncharacterized protein n=1 Tax=Thorsellia anophelis DSM 18579 TaxID=1123402 RepID=A0A1I0DAI9_9GAMM|nr:hypothetical protein [Thorsellia anophelis]SET28577.1 hypothetical protein SAMN02583745_01899 [Thorsellia anophelis DSM 18579]